MALFMQQAEQYTDGYSSSMPAFAIALRSCMLFQLPAVIYFGGSFSEDNQGGATIQLQSIPEVPSLAPAGRSRKATTWYDRELPTPCYQ
jgi:hypothetical protein